MSQHIYTYDASNDQLNEIGGAGHIIKDAAGTTYTKRENLQFEGATVTDDPTNNGTIVSVDETNFVGTLAQWNSLTLAQKAKYKTVDLTDDFNGDPIDATPTANSLHAVQSGGTYTALAAKANASDVTALTEALTNEVATRVANGAHNLLENTATSQVVDGVTFTVKPDKSITVSTGSGGATGNAMLIWTFDLEAGSYILSSGRNDTAWTKYSISVYKSGVVNISDYEGGAFTLSAKATGIECRVRVANGTVITTPITFYPMIRRASDTNPTYQQYAMTNRELTEILSDTGTYDVFTIIGDEYNSFIRGGFNFKNHNKTYNVVINSAKRFGDATDYASSFSVSSSAGRVAFYASSATGLNNAAMYFNITVS